MCVRARTINARNLIGCAGDDGSAVVATCRNLPRANDRLGARARATRMQTRDSRCVCVCAIAIADSIVHTHVGFYDDAAGNGQLAQKEFHLFARCEARRPLVRI